MNEEKKVDNEDEYILETNDNEEKIIKKLDKQTNQQVNIIFENEEETNAMPEVLKQLTKFYIEDILKLEN